MGGGYPYNRTAAAFKKVVNRKETRGLSYELCPFVEYAVKPAKVTLKWGICVLLRFLFSWDNVCDMGWVVCVAVSYVFSEL